MKKLAAFTGKRLLAGLLLVLPLYLAVLALFKAASSLSVLLRPFTHLLPEALPAEGLLSLLLVLLLCFLIGLGLYTARGRAWSSGLEHRLLEKIPGYSLFRSLARQLALEPEEQVWKPALVELRQALVPAFIIEELPQARYTVFVPSAPTPFAGTIYVLDAARVHIVDVPFAVAAKAISKWGAGTGRLVEALDKSTPLRGVQ